jgi:hypothetical protein
VRVRESVCVWERGGDTPARPPCADHAPARGPWPVAPPWRTRPPPCSAPSASTRRAVGRPAHLARSCAWCCPAASMRPIDRRSCRRRGVRVVRRCRPNHTWRGRGDDVVNSVSIARRGGGAVRRTGLENPASAASSEAHPRRVSSALWQCVRGCYWLGDLQHGGTRHQPGSQCAAEGENGGVSTRTATAADARASLPTECVRACVAYSNPQRKRGSGLGFTWGSGVWASHSSARARAYPSQHPAYHPRGADNEKRRELCRCAGERTVEAQRPR